MVEIAMIYDKDYIIPSLTTIESICSSKRDNSKYLIYMISGGEVHEYYKSVFKLFEEENVIIKFIDEPLGELASINEYTNSSYGVATPSALLKFKLPFLIKSNKLLYLDGDLIIRDDLTELYEIDISDYYGGVIVDSGTIYSKREEMVSNPAYFNSGVMLLNLDILRKNNITETLIKEKTANYKTGLMDQDTFNAVFKGHTKLLDIRWNCLAVNLIRALFYKKLNLSELNEKYSISVSSLSELVNSAKIIHYASKDKPWKYHNIPLAQEWYHHFLLACKKVGFKPSQIRRMESDFKGWEKIYCENQPQIIVSLTSYPARISTVHLVIDTLLTQTRKPDRILLWLATEKFPNKEKDLPSDLLEKQKEGLEIMWCEKDLGPHTKYFYTMKNHRDKTIITVDDDKYYPANLVEILIGEAKKYPDTVCCVRAHMIKMYDRRTFKPYNEWQNGERLIDSPNDIVFPTGVGGVLYPPDCFSDELFNVETIKRTCLFADDLWLKWRELKEEIPCVLAVSNINPPCVEPEQTQKNALYKTNVNNGGNDESWKKIMNSESSISIFGHDIFDNLYYQYCSVDFDKIAQIRRLKSEIMRIENSYSYKIGCYATWMPRKLRRIMKKIKKH